MKRILILTAAITMLALLGACSTPGIRTDKIAVSQESRVQYLILHYTALDFPTSLKVLSERDVSSHYLVGDDKPTTIYRLVDENQMAYHAGVSEWKGQSKLNMNSIGIEIVNLGYQDTPQGRLYYPYPQYQIDSLIALVKDIVQRHHIKPENILGHAEIAPQRKPDPGPAFPWKQLAQAGLVPSPDVFAVQQMQKRFDQQLPDTRWFQQRLTEHGYATPQTGTLDKATRNVLSVFQMRYRPDRCDGIPDAETAALLAVLTGSSDLSFTH